MAILMRYDGIDGECRMEGYAGCLELLSFGWGVSRATRVVRGAGVETGECAVGDVVITRKADGSSARLLAESLLGQFDRAVKIHFARTGVVSATDLMSYELQDCGISSYAISHVADGEYPMESIALAFRAVTYLTYPIDDTLRAPPDSASYDIVTGGR